MGTARIRIEPVTKSNSKPDRYLTKDLGILAKKRKKMLVLGSIFLAVSVILNIYQLFT